MKITIKRFLGIILALLTVISTVGCSTGGNYFYKNNSSEYVFKYGDYSINDNFYKYWLARYKAVLMYTYYDIDDTSAFWDKSYGDGGTANEVFTAYADETIKNYLMSIFLFDDLGLTLSEATLRSVDEQLEEIVADGYEGNVASLNEEAFEYGINYNMLREIYIAEKKTEMVYDHLCENILKDKLSDDKRDQYLSENYAHTTHIFVSTKYSYNLDKDGNPIYNDDGSYTTELTREEIAKKEEIIKEIDGADLNLVNFLEYQSKYNDDIAIDKYKNGYFVSTNISFDTEYVTAALTMKPGEIKKVQGTNGVYYILKEEMPERAYSDKDNADFFADYDKKVLGFMYWEYMDELYKGIDVNKDVKSQYDIKSIAPCWYF